MATPLTEYSRPLALISMLALSQPGAALQSATSGLVTQTGAMTVPRFDHTATLLPNGKVLLVAGLARNGVPLQTAELYDPGTGECTPAGKPRLFHGWGSLAVLLRTGKVLLAGGSTGPRKTLAGAELYDPTTNTFFLTGSMAVARDGALGILLRDGNVLVVGGQEDSGDQPASAEVYHSSKGVFLPTGKPHASGFTSATELKEGKILLVGTSTAELYDPATGEFAVTGGLNVARTKFGVATLLDGRVLVVGGQINGAWGERVASTEIYDPASGRFAMGPDMKLKRFKLRKSVVTLKDGRVLIGGGAELPEVYDPGTGTFSFTDGVALDGFLFSTATLLENGAVLLTGGYPRPGGAGVNHAWLYNP